MKLKPTYDRVVIEKNGKIDKTEGGIYLPNGVAEDPNEGTVVAVGPGPLASDGTRIKMDVEVGDKVFFRPDALQHLWEEGNKTYIVVNEIAVIGIIEKAH